MSDLRQAPEYCQWMRTIGWQVEQGAFIKKFPLIPWIFVKIQRQKQVNIQPKWKGLIKIEPGWGDKIDYQALGFKPDRSPMLPSKTIWLDLRKSLSQLLKEMHAKARYNIKKTQNSNVKCQIIRGDKITKKQIREFYKIYRENCRKQKFWGINFNQLKNLLRCFKEKAWLLATDEGGLIILIYDKVAYYSHNGVSEEGKRKFVPTLLTWEAIKLAKKLGCRKFDFEGIDDKRWPGFTRFKRSFGGEEVEYRGSLSKWYLCI